MSRALEPGRLYRMPVHFGPSPGPRERPEGGRPDPDVARETLRVSVSFRTRAEALNAILPPGFALDGEPVARLEASYMSGIPWLAGRGYNTFGVTIPAVWEGDETVAGDLVAVLFENLADPIITGREELGWNKLWCELPDLQRVADTRPAGRTCPRCFGSSTASPRCPG
jgi:acetoacetate decarboxylase